MNFNERSIVFNDLSMNFNDRTIVRSSSALTTTMSSPTGTSRSIEPLPSSSSSSSSSSSLSSSSSSPPLFSIPLPQLTARSFVGSFYQPPYHHSHGSALPPLIDHTIKTRDEMTSMFESEHDFQRVRASSTRPVLPIKPVPSKGSNALSENKELVARYKRELREYPNLCAIWDAQHKSPVAASSSSSSSILRSPVQSIPSSWSSSSSSSSVVGEFEVVYSEIHPGARSHCMWYCVSEALRIKPNELREMATAMLATIKTPLELTLMGFDTRFVRSDGTTDTIFTDSGAKDFALALAAYRNIPAHLRLYNGGMFELNLISRALNHRVVFHIFHREEGPSDVIKTYSTPDDAHRRHLSHAEPYFAEVVVCLHHCTLGGRERVDGVIIHRNHFSLLELRQTAAQLTRGYWPLHIFALPESRAEFKRLVHAAVNEHHKRRLLLSQQGKEPTADVQPWPLDELSNRESLYLDGTRAPPPKFIQELIATIATEPRVIPDWASKILFPADAGHLSPEYQAYLVRQAAAKPKRTEGQRQSAAAVSSSAAAASSSSPSAATSSSLSAAAASSPSAATSSLSAAAASSSSARPKRPILPTPPSHLPSYPTTTSKVGPRVIAARRKETEKHNNDVQIYQAERSQYLKDKAAYDSLPELTLRIGTKDVPRHRVDPMQDATWIKVHHNDCHRDCLFATLQKEGFLLIRDAIPSNDCEEAKHAMLNILESKGAISIESKKIGEGIIQSQAGWDKHHGIKSSKGSSPTERIKGWTINIETGDVVEGPAATRTSEDWSATKRNEAINKVYKGEALTAILNDICAHNPDFMSMRNSTGDNKTIAPFVMLPECSWARAKGPGEPTREHCDQFYFAKHTDVMGDHHLRTKVDEVKPIYMHAVAKDGETVYCVMCRRHFFTRFLVPPAKAGIKRWQCHGCVNLPSSFYTVWICLTKLGDGDSKLAVIPGSHLRYRGYESPRGELPGDYKVAEENKARWQVPTSMNPGDIIIFNHKLIHASTSNNSDRFRLSFDVRITTGLRQQAESECDPHVRTDSRVKLDRACTVRGALNPQMMPPVSNQPPFVANLRDAAKFDAPQMIMMDDDQAALDFNCRQLSLEVRESTIPNAGNGLFTTGDYVSTIVPPETGDELWHQHPRRTVAYMFGIIRPQSRYEHLIRFPSTAVGAGETRFVEDYKKGIETVYDIGDQLQSSEDSYLLFISCQCPMVYMNNPTDSSGSKYPFAKIIASLAWNKTVPFQTRDRFQWDLFPLTVRDIDVAAGTEIFFQYNMPRHIWKSVRRRMRDHQTAEIKKHNFHIQWENLLLFMQLPATRSLMKSFRYAEQVGPVEPRVSALVAQHFVLQDSEGIPGILGVIVKRALSVEQFEIPYDGIVLPTAVYNMLNKTCHCPTAVVAENLNYLDDKGRVVEVTIIGDPRSIGPNINSSDGDKVTAPMNVHAKLMERPHNDPSLMAAIKLAAREGTKVIVPSGFAFVNVERKSLAGAEYGMSELRAKYGPAFYGHMPDVDNAFCDECYKKTTCEGNELILCDDRTDPARPCLVGRHQKCYDGAAIAGCDVAAMEHYCDHHRPRSIASSTPPVPSPPSMSMSRPHSPIAIIGYSPPRSTVSQSNASIMFDPHNSMMINSPAQLIDFDTQYSQGSSPSTFPSASTNGSDLSYHPTPEDASPARPILTSISSRHHSKAKRSLASAIDNADRPYRATVQPARTRMTPQPQPITVEDSVPSVPLVSVNNDDDMVDLNDTSSLVGNCDDCDMVSCDQSMRAIPQEVTYLNSVHDESSSLIDNDQDVVETASPQPALHRTLGPRPLINADHPMGSDMDIIVNRMQMEQPVVDHRKTNRLPFNEKKIEIEDEDSYSKKAKLTYDGDIVVTSSLEPFRQLKAYGPMVVARRMSTKEMLDPEMKLPDNASLQKLGEVDRAKMIRTLVGARKDATLTSEKVKCKAKADIDRLVMMMIDYSLIAGCKHGCCKANPGQKTVHPFDSHSTFFNYRQEKCEQPFVTRMHVIDHLINRQHSESVGARCVRLNGRLICQACLQLSVGYSDVSMHRLHKIVVDGHVESHRQLKTEKSRHGATTITIASLIRSMMQAGIGQTFPGLEGGRKYVSVSMPFRTKAAFSSQVLLFAAEKGRGDAAAMIAKNNSMINPTSLNRAFKYLEDVHRTTISITKTIKFMRCTKCTKFDNEKQALLRTQNSDGFVGLNARINQHMMQVMNERKYCAAIKIEATRINPKVWLMSLDGMDQAKTSLPHLVTFSKDTDAMFPLKMHVVSLLCYGGDDPLIALINLQEIKKDSALTAHNMMTAINMQWTAHMAKHNGELKHWPDRLHVTFDNAVGENINRNVFMFLAALVHHGVFKIVTVGTLLIGHTHNINDQIFSVWSKYLNVHDVKTFEAFKEMLRTEYTMKTDKDTAASSGPVSGAPLPSAAPSSASAMRDGATDDDDYEGVSDSIDDMLNHDVTDPIRRTGRGKNANVVRIQEVVDFQSWITEDHFERHPTVGAGSYHLYTFNKDVNDDTYMHAKFVNNAELIYRKYDHPYEVEGVMYRKRYLMWSKDERLTKDPVSLPLLHVDIAEPTRLVEALHLDGSLLDHQKADLDALLLALTNNFIKQGDECKVCNELTMDLHHIGVLSRPHASQSKDEHDAYDDRVNHRDKVQELMKKHMAESQSSDSHERRVMVGFWTNWLTTRIPMIQAFYGVTPVGDVTTGATEGLLNHPTDYDIEEKRNVVRVEVAQMQSYGPPRQGDYAVLRVNDPDPAHPPFRAAYINNYLTPSVGALQYESERASYEVAQRDKAKGYDQMKLPPQHSLTDLPDEDMAKDMSDANVLEWSKRKSMKKKVGKDSIETSAEENVSVFLHSHVELIWMNHESGLNESGTKRKRKEKDSDPDDLVAAPSRATPPRRIRSAPISSPLHASSSAGAPPFIASTRKAATHIIASSSRDHQMEIEDDAPLSNLLAAASSSSSSNLLAAASSSSLSSSRAQRKRQPVLATIIEEEAHEEVQTIDTPAAASSSSANRRGRSQSSLPAATVDEPTRKSVRLSSAPLASPKPLLPKLSAVERDTGDYSGDDSDNDEEGNPNDLYEPASDDDEEEGDEAEANDRLMDARGGDEHDIDVTNDNNGNGARSHTQAYVNGFKKLKGYGFDGIDPCLERIQPAASIICWGPFDKIFTLKLRTINAKAWALIFQDLTQPVYAGVITSERSEQESALASASALLPLKIVPFRSKTSISTHEHNIYSSMLAIRSSFGCSQELLAKIMCWLTPASVDSLPSFRPSSMLHVKRLPEQLVASMCYLSEAQLPFITVHPSLGLVERDLPCWMPQIELSRVLYGMSGVKTIEAIESHFGLFVWAPEFSNVHSHFSNVEPILNIEEEEYIAGAEQYYRMQSTIGTDAHEKYVSEMQAKIKHDDSLTWPSAVRSIWHGSIGRPGWDAAKLRSMTKAMEHKFASRELTALLRSTSSHTLVYIQKDDDFWGTGEGSIGGNEMGSLLAELRTASAAASSSSSSSPMDVDV